MNTLIKALFISFFMVTICGHAMQEDDSKLRPVCSGNMPADNKVTKKFLSDIAHVMLAVHNEFEHNKKNLNDPFRSFFCAQKNRLIRALSIVKQFIVNSSQTQPSVSQVILAHKMNNLLEEFEQSLLVSPLSCEHINQFN